MQHVEFRKRTILVIRNEAVYTNNLHGNFADHNL